MRDFVVITLLCILLALGTMNYLNPRMYWKLFFSWLWKKEPTLTYLEAQKKLGLLGMVAAIVLLVTWLIYMY